MAHLQMIFLFEMVTSHAMLNHRRICTRATFFGSVGVTFWAIRTIVATVLSEKWMWIWPVMSMMPLIFSDAC